MIDLRAQLHAALGDAYHIDRELGGGGMSRVFVATESALGREVVIKVLPPEMAESVSVDRFKREMQLSARLQHPHIVPVLATGGGDSLLYYTMPLVQGESLRQRLAGGSPISTHEAVRIWREMLDALSYAHGRAVIHRDIKPENVLLSGTHAVVTDFGIARAVEAATGAARLTATGLALGTPAYMSPEQAAGDQVIDARADLYSAGLVMYEMLSGTTPFRGTTARELVAAQLTKAPAKLVPRDPDCPRQLVDLVMRCLSKAPQQRPASAADILAELDTFTTPVPPAAAASRSRRRRTVLLGLGAFAIVAAGGLAWGASTHRLPFMTPAGPANDSLKLAILIAQTKHDPGDSTLANQFAETLAGDLGKDPWIYMDSPSVVQQALPLLGFSARTANRDTIIYIAKHLRVSAYLILTLSRAGTGYVLSAEAIGARDDNSLGVLQASANGADQLPGAIKRLAGSLARDLVRSRSKLPFASSVGVLGAANPRALEYYEKAQPELAKRNWLEAIRLLRLAVQQDSTFSDAWVSLYVALGNEGGNEAEAVRAIAHAYRTRTTMRSPIGRMKVVGDYWWFMGRPDSGVAAFDSLIKILPNSDRVGINDQGLAFDALREYDLAEESFRKSMDTSYQFLNVPNSNLVRSLLFQGKVDSARSEVARLTRADSTSTTTWEAEYFLAVATRSWSGVRRIASYDLKHQGQTAQIRGLGRLRVVPANRGQLAAFDSLNNLLAHQYLETGAVRGYMGDQLQRARLYVDVAGEPSRALAIVDSALAKVDWARLDPLDRPYGQLITVLAQAGDTARARSYAAEWARETPAEFRMIDSLGVLDGRGEIALAEGNPREALRLMHAADIRGCIPCFYPGYAEAYDELKEPDSSLVWYQKYANATVPGNPMGDAFDLARTYLRLGELYEDRHDPKDAIKYYTALANLWAHADPVLQPTVADVKRRIARLDSLSH
jgi:eukaryotic-like serine/threonine-protein kinase